MSTFIKSLIHRGEAFLTAFVWKPDLQKEELVSQHQVSGISGSLHLAIGFGFFRNKFNKCKVLFFFWKSGIEVTWIIPDDAYSWLCSQGSPLVMLRGPYQTWISHMQGCSKSPALEAEVFEKVNYLLVEEWFRMVLKNLYTPPPSFSF